MAARREAIEGRFNEIVSSEDVAALGTPPSSATSGGASSASRPRLPRIRAIAELAALQEKLRLVRGVLFWDLTQAWQRRLYAQRRELKALDRALGRGQQRAGCACSRRASSAPTTTGDFAPRIARCRNA